MQLYYTINTEVSMTTSIYRPENSKFFLFDRLS
jgi:hypothetical protein